MALVHEAAATVYVATRDRDLARRADQIVAGRVRAVEALGTAAGGVRTRITLDVEVRYKGRQHARVVVEQPGGALPGRTLHVDGVPRFAVGERHLLFLAEREDGTTRTVALGMGAYALRRSADGDVVAERALGAPVIGGARHRRLRFARLVRTIERAVATAPAAPHAPRTPAAHTDGMRVVERVAVGSFTLMDHPGGRWREPDLGRPVTIDVDASGDAGLGADASLAAVDAALAAWTSVSGAAIELVRGGAAEAMPMFCDGVSQIVFNDPFWEMPNPHGCSGVLAMGGYCTSGGTDLDVVDGVPFRRIVEGNITFANGFAGCPFWTADNLAEVATHEIGHAIGIGHASEEDDEPSAALKDATMYYRAHFDGRGASVRPDDVAAVRALYPGGDEPVDDDVDRDGVADADDNCPGSDPALGVPNAAQTDLDSDGLGDVCDPCPLGDACGQLLGSRIRASDHGAGMLSWSAVVDAALVDGTSTLARVVLVSGDGIILDSNAVSGRSGRGRGRGPRVARRQVFRSTTARLSLGHAPQRGLRLRLKVRPFVAPATPVGLLRVNLQVGDTSFTAPIICRPSGKYALACTS